MFGPEILLDGMDIAMAPYGAYWRNLRKLCMTVLLAAHKVRQLGPLRDRETISLVRKVGAAGQGGEPVNLGELVVSVRCIFVHVYFPHLLGGFLHILTCTCNYMLWPLAPREYNLSIPNMVSEQ
jgi:hypothetical protein